MIIPAILETDFEEIKRKIKIVENMAERVQIDVADNKLVKGQTFLDLDKIGAIETPTEIEIHLMVHNPTQFLQKKYKNITRVCSQVEAGEIAEFLTQAKKLEYSVGLVIGPKTKIGVLEPYLNQLNYVQFMAVEPGAQGRPYESEVVKKIETFRAPHPTFPLQVDGGINAKNMDDILKAGANDVVIGSAIFFN